MLHCNSIAALSYQIQIKINLEKKCFTFITKFQLCFKDKWSAMPEVQGTTDRHGTAYSE